MHALIIGSAVYVFCLIAWIGHCLRLAYGNARLMPAVPSDWYQMREQTNA